ncbi:MAG TPA: hypothetical protein VFS91_01945, partial [Nitrobacter sp.]|nr:hypothetical protein [Nitrobacter sp.]
LMTSKADTVTIAAIGARIPTLVEARMLVESFQTMVRKKLVADLDPWIATASLSLIGSFASGIIRDRALCAGTASRLQIVAINGDIWHGSCRALALDPAERLV